jgi:hypothetical protein
VTAADTGDQNAFRLETGHGILAQPVLLPIIFLPDAGSQAAYVSAPPAVPLGTATISKM